MTPLVAVLGATGRVGGEVSARLARLQHQGRLRLRVGGRRPDRLERLLEALGVPGEAIACDLWDDTSLAAFCRGADVVVGCAGPTYRIGGRIALAALRAGADHVDVGGDDPALEQIRDSEFADRGRVLLSAGTVPGLSALLPRWLAARGHQRIEGWAGGMERCTTTVGQDMILSLSTGGPGGSPYGQPLAAWRNHRPQPRAELVREGVRLPGFGEETALQPLLSAEAERVARVLGLRELLWWNVWPHGQVWNMLGQLPALLADPGTSTDALVQRMCRASELDLVGHTPWYRMRIRGESASSSTTVDLACDSSAVLTSAMAAATVEHVLEHPVPPGPGFAADIVDPARVLDVLRRDPRVLVHVDDGTAHTEIEEGEL